MTQWVKACITKHDSLSPVPRTYKVEHQPCRPSSDLQVLG